MRERAGSDWADEHPEYDVESEPFPSHVYEMAHPVYLWDGAGTFEELEAEAPHRAYVVDAYSRMARLVDVLRSLSVVEKLLSFDDFPVVTPAGKIHREAWLRVANDTYLVRITAVRDCLFLLTATVFELDLRDRDVTLRALKARIEDDGIVGVLDRIARTAPDVREQRDMKFHRGVERDFDEAGLYKSISIIEMYGGDGLVHSHDGSEPAWDLRVVHARAVETVRTEMRQSASELIDLALDLFDLLEPEYDRRWAGHRDRARSVREWERPSNDL